MSKGHSSVSIGQSPLLRTLSQWGSGSSRVPKKVFSSRLAELIDISDAIELSDFFKGLKRVGRSDDALISNLPAQCRTHRAAIQLLIDASFEPGTAQDDISGGKGFRVPEPAEDLLTDPEAFKPYRRFYTLMQSELERRVAQTRGLVLNNLRGTSDELAQVVAIERALEKMVVNYSRRCLGVISGLAAQRFDELRLEQQRLDDAQGWPSNSTDWLAVGGWLARFHVELQHLLRAELELRWQPIEGLLLALGHETAAQESV